MSMGTDHGGNGYAPLPQSLSNTDTENEDDHLTMPSYIPNQSHRMFETDIHENDSFTPLDETKNCINRLRDGQNILGYYSDDAPIMVVDRGSENDLWKRSRMSFIRQFCLVMSVLLCLATIIIFSYVLPCDMAISAPPLLGIQSLLPWNKTLQGVELHGPISIVPGNPYNLIFMFRAQQYGEQRPITQGQNIPPSRGHGGGIISVHGGSDVPIWWVPLEKLPTEIDCLNLDVDASGITDCLVAGERGLLVSIEPIAGTVQWSSRAFTYSKLPIILPDINSDGIDDLLSIQITNETRLALVLISGKNGRLLKRRMTPECHHIQIDSLVEPGVIYYLCHESNGKQSVKSVFLKDLVDVGNSQNFRAKLKKHLRGNSKIFSVSDNILDGRRWELTPYHNLILQNRGVCPGDHCQTSVNLTFGKLLNESHLIWSHVGPNAYGMEPAILRQIDKPYITGFAMKFWHWNTPELLLEKLNSSVIKRKLTERILVVIMNRTQVNAVNASQSEINQLCQETSCQPSLKLQTQSIVIADLNKDGSRELISYQATYEFDKVNLLKSKIQVVRFDVEVAKLDQNVL